MEELAAIREGAEALGLTQAQTLEHLGETTCEVYLNESGSWRRISYALDHGDATCPGATAPPRILSRWPLRKNLDKDHQLSHDFQYIKLNQPNILIF